jgi:diguanylate cyclase (GGDEF)-like protein
MGLGSIRSALLAPAKFSSGRPRAAIIVALIAWVGVIGGLTVALSNSQSATRRLIVTRTEARAQLGAEFATLYVKDLLGRERTEGLTWLQGRHVSGQLFGRTARSMGLSAAVLLDGQGRLLQVLPADPALIGVALSHRYAHLASAVAGRPAVSNVVPSAARHYPVVGFAIPFQTAFGRRVFSGAYDVSRTPLGAYLSHMTTVPGRRVYLTDSQGNLIASSQGAVLQTTLASVDPTLAATVARVESGAYASRGVERYFVSAPVADTPWRILMSMPEAQLFKSIDGPGERLAWLAILGLALTGFAAILLFDRLHRGRGQLRQLNAELDHIAHTDPLTGIQNRRAIERALEETLSAARRHHHSFSVLMIDIDHFKRINDTLGHHAGDRALMETSQALASSLRTEDSIGRWGGEEFLVVLPFTNEAGATHTAERVRNAVGNRKSVAVGAELSVTVTIGLAHWSGESAATLIAKADSALYAGKAAGRNTVFTAPTLLHTGNADSSSGVADDSPTASPVHERV